MIFKILILIALVPLIVCVVLRMLFSKKAFHTTNAIRCSISAEELQQRLAEEGSTTKRLVERQMHPYQMNSKKASALGYVAFLAGRDALALKSPLVEIRRKMILSAAMLPAFGVVLGVLGVFAMRLNSIILLAVLAGCLATSCLLLLFTLQVDLESAKYGKILLRKKSQIHRVSELEAIDQAVTAAAWDTILPMGFKRFF